MKVRRLRRSLSPRRSINILLFALWVAVSATIGGTKAFAGTIELAMRATGAVSGEIQTRRDLDDSHFCALLGPAGKEQTFELSFNKRQTDTFVVAADFGFSLSASGIVGRPWDETQPSAILQVAIGNRRFVGLLGVDPSFHLRVAVDPGDGTGTFSANHLVELPEGATIDIEGSWHCVPNQVTADTSSSGSRTEGPHLAALGSAVTRPAALPRPYAKKASAPHEPHPARPQGVAASTGGGGNTAPQTPAEADKGRHFRLSHLNPCRWSTCGHWTATDLNSGQVSEASVDFVRLKLAAGLIPPAQAGLVELWITRDARPDGNSRRLLISAQRLDGVIPRPTGSSPKKSPARQ